MFQVDQSSKRLFILDTNVLMHDPTALFRFQEHDVYLPMVVLEELDAGKKGVSEVARNVRQVSRFLDTLMQNADGDAIELGIPLSTRGVIDELDSGQHGRLFFQTHTLAAALPDALAAARLPGRGQRGGRNLGCRPGCLCASRAHPDVRRQELAQRRRGVRRRGLPRLVVAAWPGGTERRR